MGSILSASCDCGYTKDEIYVGRTSIISKTNFHFPHYCPKCKILFDGYLPGDTETVCPECGTNDAIVYYDERVCKIEEELPYELNGYTRRLSFKMGKCLCPACGKFSLKFDHCISYD